MINFLLAMFDKKRKKQTKKKQKQKNKGPTKK